MFCLKYIFLWVIFLNNYILFKAIMPRSALFFLIIVLLLFACKKEEDNRIPTITYFAPAHAQQFEVLDTIPVQALIEDEKGITSVRVNLTDEDFIAVSPSKTFFPNAGSFQLDILLPIDNESLESGKYFVLIRAENGVNFKNQYQEIAISGLEQEYIQALIITEGETNSSEVFGTVNFEIATPLFSIAGDFIDSEISSADQLLFVAGENNLNVHAYNLETFGLSWSREITPGKPMHRRGCLHFDELLYTTYNYDYIHGYSTTGQIGFNVFIDEFDAPARIYKHHDFILTEVQKKNANNPFIGTYFALTGNEKQRRFIDFNIIDFYTIDNDNVLIIANKPGKGEIYTYDVTADVLTFEYEIQEPINASIRSDNNAIVLAGNSSIYSWSLEFSTLVTILNDGAHQMVYEKLSGRLLTTWYKKLDVYVYPEMVNQKTLLLSDTILDIHIQYSK